MQNEDLTPIVDVALVSCLNLPEPDPDAALLAAALAACEIESRVLAWDDDAADWSQAGLTVLRSSWNYPLHREAFLKWAESTARVSQLWNPWPVVRWNTHKGYLLELERRGVPVVPTVLVKCGSGGGLRSILAERGWTDAVVKPAVSAASYRTVRVGRSSLDAGEAHFIDLVADRDVLVQQYLPSVEGHGERALIWIDGQLTHAVRKSPRFEGQSEAVSVTAVDTSQAEAALARRALEGLGGKLLYARVDMAPGPDGQPVIMELELVEPSLFLRQSERALASFVSGIGSRLDALRTRRR